MGILLAECQHRIRTGNSDFVHARSSDRAGQAADHRRQRGITERIGATCGRRDRAGSSILGQTAGQFLLGAHDQVRHQPGGKSTLRSVEEFLEKTRPAHVGGIPAGNPARRTAEEVRGREKTIRYSLGGANPKSEIRNKSEILKQEIRNRRHVGVLVI